MPETAVPAAPAHEDEAPAPSTVGNTFMRQYYHFLAKEPQSLHRFYKDESRWCHGVGSRMEEPIAGQRAINEQILRCGYAGARVDLDAGSIDCQNSLGGGVLVLVTGVMTLRNSPTPKPFVQTFFLAVQPKGYFVLNDCLRFLELPGGPAEAAIGTPVAVAPASPTRNGKNTSTPTPTPTSPAVASPVAAPVVASPKKTVTSPVKAPSAAAAKTTTTTTTKTKVVKAAATAPPMSPVKATATVASSPVKKTTPPSPTKVARVEEQPVAAPAKPVSPVKSPKQEKPKAAAPVAAPAEPVVPAEPEKPKTWAQLFAASKTAAAIAPSSGAGATAAPTSTPAAAKPSTPKASATPATAPSQPPAAPTAGAPAPLQSPKSKTASSKEKEGSRSRLFSLFIRDVPGQARDSDLRELFKGYGSIAGVNIITSRGYAFVDYYEQESMRAALAETAEFRLLDKLLQVDERKEAQRGGFRGTDSRGRGRGHGPKAGRGDRKERNGEDAPASKGDRRENPRREKTGNRRGGKVEATPHGRAE